MKLDLNNPWDNLLKRVLDGEDIPCEEFEDFICDLSETSFKDELIEDNVNEDYIKNSWKKLLKGYKDFFNKYGLNTLNRYEICSEFFKNKDILKDSNFIWFFSLFICETNVLNNDDINASDSIQYERYNLIKQHYLLENSLRKRQLINKDWKLALYKAVNVKSSMHSPVINKIQFENVFHLYANIYSTNCNYECFKDHLVQFMQNIYEFKELHVIAPLYLYQIFTKHRSRLRNKEPFYINSKALWKISNYNIDFDNGKNFRSHDMQIRLFLGLCEIFNDDNNVDIQLCKFGFCQLSNLGIYYHRQIHINIDDELPESLESLVNENFVTCFTQKAYISPYYRDISSYKINSYIEKNYNKTVCYTKDYIIKYTNSIIDQYNAVKGNASKKFITNIIRNSNIPKKYMPQNITEIAMLSYIIEKDLKYITDCIAINQIIQFMSIALDEVNYFKDSLYVEI